MITEEQMSSFVGNEFDMEQNRLKRLDKPRVRYAKKQATASPTDFICPIALLTESVLDLCSKSQ